jgi:membrane protein DedA with SNARE-associated domain
VTSASGDRPADGPTGDDDAEPDTPPEVPAPVAAEVPTGVAAQVSSDRPDDRGGGRRPLIPPEPPRGALPFLLVPIGIMIVASNVANVAYATLIASHPLWLLGLSSVNRYLAAVTPYTVLWSYLLVGGLRLLAPDGFFYLLGYWYGDRGVHAVEQRLPSVGTAYRSVERVFRRARYVVVFVAPNNPVSLFAGADRMNPVGFAVTNVAGTIARLLLIRALGNVFESPIRTVTQFLDRWKWYLLVISAVVVLGSTLIDRRRGRSDLGGLRGIGEDLADQPEPGVPEGPPEPSR